MKINPKQFLEALDAFETSKGISKATVIENLKEAMIKGFKKQLGGDDALVRVEIDLEKGVIEMAQLKTVVEEVEDDFLEISLEEANQGDKKYELGDLFEIPCKPEQIAKSTAISIKNVFNQRSKESEKQVILDIYKDKIGEMITGIVERVDEAGVSVNIGKATIFVPRKELIGDERFFVQDAIRLYVRGVSSGTKGTKVEVSRSDEGFLRRVFEESIHEIYDGTIVIKGIARKAGDRSKVAVYASDANVDPAGACIGPNGSRIQKIVAQFGNATNKEKIDVILYSANPALYIFEALKPAPVLGLNVDTENKVAIAVVKNDSLSVAIGKKGVNVLLAAKLTGYKIDVKELDTAIAEGIEYKTIEEIEREDIEAKQAAVRKEMEKQAAKALEIAKAKEAAALLAARKEEEERRRKAMPLSPDYVAPSDRHYEDEISEEEEEILLAEVEREELLEQLNASTTKEIEEEVVVEEEVKEEVVTPSESTTVVKTTTTLEDLERELASEASKKQNTSYKKRNKKAKEEEEEEIIRPQYDDNSQRMSIYTEEELKEFEEEDASYDEYDDSDDVDYDEYDDYYDDDNN